MEAFTHLLMHCHTSTGKIGATLILTGKYHPYTSIFLISIYILSSFREYDIIYVFSVLTFNSIDVTGDGVQVIRDPTHIVWGPWVVKPVTMRFGWHHQCCGIVILHYDNVIMCAIASRITSLTTVYLIVYSRADQRKHQSSASLAFVRGIHRRPVNSPHKGPVTRKMGPFDDVIMVKNHLGNTTPTIFVREMFHKIISWPPCNILFCEMTVRR